MVRYKNLKLIIRKLVINSSAAHTIVSPLVKYYRRIVSLRGRHNHTLKIPNGPDVVFEVESLEEVRHFYPIHGELEELSDLVAELRSDDVFYDIGAHIGVFSIVANQVVDDGQIFAFEPVWENVEKMEKNLQLNDASDTTIYDCALSDTTQSGTIGVDSHQSGTIGYLTSENRDKNKNVRGINYVRGSDIIERDNIPKPTVIKIDVEGAELKVLRGLEEALDSCRILYVEISEGLDKMGDSEKELIGFLEDRDFEQQPIGTGTDSRQNYKFTRSVS